MPPDPNFAGSPSGASAEHAVHTALRDTLPEDAVLFANLGILDGLREHELGLFVAWPNLGLAVIETKSGHIERRDGAWYRGRPPNDHRIDPVRQAQDARHALTRWLAADGAPDVARSRIVHRVAFPHTAVPADWHAPAPRRGLARRRRRTARHWAPARAAPLAGRAGRARRLLGRVLPGTDVFHGHVLGFKGLERNVVVLAVNGFREAERARRLI